MSYKFLLKYLLACSKDQVHKKARKKAQQVKEAAIQASQFKCDPPNPCKKLDAVAHICNHSTPVVRWETETGKLLEVWGEGAASLEWSPEHSCRNKRDPVQQGGQ